jgi:glucan phosphoethanolaminetransferase (alkaline phosphatase superfamily)
MPPPPYFKAHFIDPSSFKAAINTKLEKPLVSLFRLIVRLLQLAFALASGISYAIELSNQNISHQSAFIYTQVVFGLTLFTLIMDSVTVRHYRFTWIIEWVLVVLWFVCFAVFYEAYVGSVIEPDYQGANVDRMKRAVWCDLINALLWSSSAIFSSAMCCTGTRAAIRNQICKRRQRKEKKLMLHEMEDMEIGTTTAPSA